MDLTKRHLMAKAGIVGASALVAYTQASGAEEVAKTPFNVPLTTIPIVGSREVFPVRRIYCIGRNYEAHAREMGSDPTREPPFFFQKPPLPKAQGPNDPQVRTVTGCKGPRPCPPEA